ncbi:MAG: cupin domain-containing protein [Actinomycetota bacterium]|nr:cupin domain-containing protein [Actinomycetota bacterium]
MNVWADEWDETDDWSGGGAKSKRLVDRGPLLGASLYELGPGNFVVYHFHHGSEELLIVLRGRPTLRGPEGERQLDEGEVVHFPAGPDGAHGLRNETEEIARYVVAGIRVSPEVAEYPDLKKITAQARTASQTGDRLWLIHDVEPGSNGPDA